MYHACEWDGSKISFLCSPGTVFNQKYLICDWWYNVDCDNSPNFYNVHATNLQSVPDDNNNNLNQFVQNNVDQIASSSSTQLQIATAPPEIEKEDLDRNFNNLTFQCLHHPFSTPQTHITHTADSTHYQISHYGTECSGVDEEKSSISLEKEAFGGNLLKQYYCQNQPNML
uniref:Chitin-binding type-2 domain-containing protein n=1 Tax=Strigamia maritima TaxID=126957 RepID=T1JJM6_STRMM